MKNTFYCVVSEFYYDGRATADITDTIQTDEKPAHSSMTTLGAITYIDWYETLEAAQQAINDTRTA